MTINTFTILAVALFGLQGQLDAEENNIVAAAPKPRPVVAPTSDQIESAIERGVDFLLSHRNKDGSWGSATSTKDLNIYAPIPGAHQAFRVAVTSLAISALIQSEDSRPEVSEAISKAEDWLIAHTGRVRRATGDAIYNVWAHSYAIEAFVDLLGWHQEGSQQQQTLRELISQQIEMLQRYESVDHGWSYYDFRYQADRPTSTPNSFTTATALIALRRAQEAGVEVPERLVQGAMTCIRRQQNPDFTYFYKIRGVTTNNPVAGINRPGGSLGRSQTCNLALRLWDDPMITDEVMQTWLDRLFSRNGWLDIGRKRPIPHESHFQVAGYFFFYGHWYAARQFDLLPKEARRPHQDQMARRMVDLQERNGSWWDYPFYAYHQPYGTAMAIMTLVDCR